jgi:hypothetical protein
MGRHPSVSPSGAGGACYAGAVSSRTVVLSCALFASFAGLFACQLPSDSPPAAPVKPAASSDEPAPLPPEETPPVETAAPAEPPDAKPVEPGITATGAPTRGTLPKALIDEKLKSIGPAVQACYESGLKTKPELHGNLNINFVVAPDGKVAHADSTEGDDALDDPATVACILNEIRKLQFPPPSGGRVFINYPLKLEKSKP